MRKSVACRESKGLSVGGMPWTGTRRSATQNAPPARRPRRRSYPSSPSRPASALERRLTACSGQVGPARCHLAASPTGLERRLFATRGVVVRAEHPLSHRRTRTRASEAASLCKKLRRVTLAAPVCLQHTRHGVGLAALAGGGAAWAGLPARAAHALTARARRGGSDKLRTQHGAADEAGLGAAPPQRLQAARPMAVRSAQRMRPVALRSGLQGRLWKAAVAPPWRRCLLLTRSRSARA